MGWPWIKTGMTQDEADALHAYLIDVQWRTFTNGPRGLKRVLRNEHQSKRDWLLRDDGGVHPAVLHHAMRRTEAEIVHMIGNIGPAVYYARRNDQHVTDLQLDL